MLCLGMKLGESVMVGDNVEVFFLSFNKGQLRLGFKAAKDIVIHRKRIWLKIQADKETPS
jgi:carbon storage regulator